MRCFICDHELDLNNLKTFKTTCAFLNIPIERYQCYNCDLIFGDLEVLNWSEETLIKNTLKVYETYKEGDTVSFEIHAFRSLSPTKDGLYLNYASGENTTTLDILRAEGYNVYNFEPFAKASCVNPYVIKSKSELMKFKFDGIFSNNAIEHFFKPIEEMKFMNSILNDNGKVCHATGCYIYAWDYSSFHVFYFIGRSLGILSEKSGFKSFHKVINTDITKENEAYVFCK